MKGFSLVLFLFLFSINLFSQDVGKILFLRGTVTMDGNPVKKNDSVREGVQFKTLKALVLTLQERESKKIL